MIRFISYIVFKSSADQISKIHSLVAITTSLNNLLWQKTFMNRHVEQWVVHVMGYLVSLMNNQVKLTSATIILNENFMCLFMVKMINELHSSKQREQESKERSQVECNCTFLYAIY